MGYFRWRFFILLCYSVLFLPDLIFGEGVEEGVDRMVCKHFICIDVFRFVFKFEWIEVEGGVNLFATDFKAIHLILKNCS